MRSTFHALFLRNRTLKEALLSASTSQLMAVTESRFFHFRDERPQIVGLLLRGQTKEDSKFLETATKEFGLHRLRPRSHAHDAVLPVWLTGPIKVKEALPAIP